MNVIASSSSREFGHRLGYVGRVGDVMPADGLVGGGVAELRNWLTEGKRCADVEIVSTDLAMGAWRAHQAAHELADQLSVSLPTAERGTLALPWDASGGGLSDATIGSWIDSEAQGEAQFLTAYAFANAIGVALAERGPLLVAVALPSADGEIGRENEWFLILLANLLRGSAGGLVFLCAREPHSPRGFSIDWKIAARQPPVHEGPGALYPGLIRSEWSAEYDASAPTIALSNGWLFLPPGQRRCPEQAESRSFAHLALTTCGSPTTFAEFHLARHGLAAPLVLHERAWQAAAGGGHDLALRLMRQAVAVADGEIQRGLMVLMLQSMLICMQRYRDVAKTHLLSGSVPETVKRVMISAKAWGAVMSGDAVHAREGFSAASPERLASEPGWMRLYLQNIQALSLFRSGDSDGALRLEHGIEAELDGRHGDLWHLRFLNRINLARVYRRIGDLDASRRYYAAAFTITDGLRNGTDLVYKNVCEAQLAEARGAARAAFDGWLRACIHLAALEAPEAMGWRVAAAILRQPVEWDGVDADAVCAAALRQLARAAEVCGLAWSTRVDEAPLAFVPLHVARQCAIDPARCTGVGSDGWSVWPSSETLPPFYDSPTHRLLRQTLVGFMRQNGPCEEWSDAGCLIIDDRLGHELAVSLTEAVEVALRLGADRLIWAGTVVDPSLWRAKAGVSVRLAAGISAFSRTPDGAARVEFKRYRPPIVVPSDLVALVERGTLAICDARRLEGLEDAHVVDIVRRAHAHDLPCGHGSANAHSGFELVGATDPHPEERGRQAAWSGK